MDRRLHKKIKLAKYNWYKYPFTYKAWIDKMIADQVYEIWREALFPGEWEHWKE